MYKDILLSNVTKLESLDFCVSVNTAVAESRRNKPEAFLSNHKQTANVYRKSKKPER